MLPDSVSAAAEYTLSPVDYGMELRTPDGRVVFDYLTKKPENIGLTSPSAACFSPVNSPAGERITDIAPKADPHHRGIFFGWEMGAFYEPPSRSNSSPTAPLRSATVRWADFWGWGVYAPRDGRVVQNREVKLVNADASHADLTIHNDLMIDNRKMGEENVTVTVTERDGVFVLDLAYTVAPTYVYELSRTAFGGFDVQCRRDGEASYSTERGTVTLRDPQFAYPELDWPSETWYDYTIRVTGDGKTVGAAVIDYPKNPPTLWHNPRSASMLNPNITAVGPVTIRPEHPLTLRYRVVVHDGPPPLDVLQKLSAEFRAL
jgi:hypothetical protein